MIKSRTIHACGIFDRQTGKTQSPLARTTIHWKFPLLRYHMKEAELPDLETKATSVAPSHNKRAASL